MAPNLLKAASSALLLSGAVHAASATSGSLSVLSFNVAGLPAILQDNDESGDKTTNTELIGTYFSEYDFDLIHVQEDFNYHAALCKSAFSKPQDKDPELGTASVRNIILTSAPKKTPLTRTRSAPPPPEVRPSVPV